MANNEEGLELRLYVPVYICKHLSMCLGSCQLTITMYLCRHVCMCNIIHTHMSTFWNTYRYKLYYMYVHFNLIMLSTTMYITMYLPIYVQEDVKLPPPFPLSSQTLLSWVQIHAMLWYELLHNQFSTFKKTELFTMESFYSYSIH